MAGPSPAKSFISGDEQIIDPQPNKVTAAEIAIDGGPEEVTVVV
jgi:hypothetical protein